MAFEIEAKARISSEEELGRLLELLRAESVFNGDFHKRDLYFAPEKEAGNGGARVHSDSLIRLRFLDPDSGEKGPAILTKKVKSFEGAVEINRETEFSVNPAEACIDLLSSLGYSRYIEKEKRGSSFMFGDAHVEICSVTGLGWFIEIEIVLSGDTGTEARENAVQRLGVLFGKLGVPEESLEKRYYIDMLRGSDT